MDGPSFKPPLPPQTVPCRQLRYPYRYRYLSSTLHQAVSAEIARGLPEDQQERGHVSGGGGGGHTEAACLADLTAGEAGGLGGLDFEVDEAAAAAASGLSPPVPEVVTQPDLAYQVPKGPTAIFCSTNFYFIWH